MSLRKWWHADRSTVPRGPGVTRERGPKAVEGGGERQRSHDVDRVFPPREASRRCGHRARTLWRARSARSGRHIGAVEWSFGFAPACPVARGRRLSRREVRWQTLETP
jgi:hypothetical protein